MELAVFVRFHALPGRGDALALAIAEVVRRSREEPGCLTISGFHSIQDPDLYWIHSRWRDEAAFDLHAGLVHTVRFIATASALIDHPFQVSRSMAMSEGPRAGTDAAAFAAQHETDLVAFALERLEAVGATPSPSQVIEVVDNLKILQGHARATLAAAETDR